MRDGDLRAAYAGLAASGPDSGLLIGMRLPGRDDDYLIRTQDNLPILLLRAWSRGAQRVPVRLQHLDVEFELECRIRDEDGRVIMGDFVRVTCRDPEATVQQLFLSVGQAIVGSLPAKASESHIYACVEAFVELFRSLARPSSKTIKGLWAELFVIDKSSDCAGMVRAWHSDDSQRFDFSKGDVHLEVKSAESLQRVHEFSIQQIRPAARTTVFIASVLMQRDSGGVGIVGLADRIAIKLKASRALETKLWTNLAMRLGRDFANAVDILFDEHHALATLRLVSATDIPCIQLPLPTDILDARLKISLDIVAEREKRSWKVVEQRLT